MYLYLNISLRKHDDDLSRPFGMLQIDNWERNEGRAWPTKRIDCSTTSISGNRRRDSAKGSRRKRYVKIIFNLMYFEV